MTSDRSDDVRDEPEANPFVAFRRFADEQFQTAFDTLRGSSSLFRDVQMMDRMQDEQQRREMWDRFEQSFQRSMNPERKAIERIEDGQRQSSNHASIEESNGQRTYLGGCPMLEVSGDRIHEESESPQATEAAWTRDGMGRAWTLDFFDSSPYSPLKIEQDRDMQKSRVNWRNAFEDLLVADAADYDPHALQFLQGRDSSLDRMSGSQWKSALLQSGLLYSHGFWQDAFTGSPMKILSQMMTSLHGIQPRFPQSELEFYETMAARDRPESDTQQETAPTQQRAPIHDKPNVLSTLTTTERRTLPDGSTTTRTVLRRRFADGSEESEETADSTPPTRTTPLSTAKADEKSGVLQQVAEQQDKRRGSGWFW